MPPATKLPGGSTIRQLAKKNKGVAPGSQQDKALLSRESVRPVLANPLTVGWPNLPNHLQNAVMHTLPDLIPIEIADYHVSRARCQQSAKRAKRKDKRRELQKGEANDDAMAVDEAESAPKPSGDAPQRPELLAHLVLGLNETIKALEHGIDNLRFRMAIMGDALEGQRSARARVDKPLETTLPATRFLPTAPAPTDSAHPEGGDKANPASDSEDAAPKRGISNPISTPPPRPLSHLIVPHHSVSPTALIDPLPLYCATYNTLLRQYAKLAKQVRSRVPKPERILGPLSSEYGEAGEPEIRLVPLGKREAELAAMIGLRRVTAIGVRSSHPNLSVLDAFQSSLTAPAYAVTLPYPTSSLRVHGGGEAAVVAEEGSTGSGSTPSNALPDDAVPSQAQQVQPEATSNPNSSFNSANLNPTSSTQPFPTIHYAPLHIKALHTTTPLDPNGRKARRLTEVRTKRVQAKEKRHAAKVELERRAWADLKAAGSGGSKTKARKVGRAARRAAKFAERKAAA